MNARSLASATLCLEMLIPGCSSLAPSPPVPVSNGALAPHALHRRTSTTLRLRVPKKRSRRSARFISPATQSATIVITPAAGCTGCTAKRTYDLGLTPSSANCVAGSGAIDCSFTFALEPGSYTGAMSTYDGPLKGGVPSGYVLSTNQSFPLTIRPGTANSIAVTLSGVPEGATYGLVSLPKGSFMDTEPSLGQTLRLTGAGQPARLAVYAVDADGYTIAGPGVPGVTATTANGYFTASAVRGSNIVTVAAPAQYTSPAGFYPDALYVTFTGPGCAQSGASCSGSLTLRPEQMVVLFDQSAGDGNIYTVDGAYVGELVGLKNPSAAAFDNEGNLFVADATLGHVYEYTFPYEEATATIAASVASSYNHGIAIDPNNNQLAVMTSTGISLYNPPYTSAAASYTLSAPEALAYDYKDDLFVTSADENLRKFVPPLFGTAPYSKSVGQTALWYLYLDDSDQPEDPTALDEYVGSRTGHDVSEFDGSLNAVGSPYTMPSTIDGVVEFDNSIYISELAGNVISDFGDFNYTIGLDGPSAMGISQYAELAVLQSNEGVVSFYSWYSNYMTREFGTGMGSATSMTLWPN